MLKETVGELQRKGYRFVTVGELLKLGEPQRTRDGYFNKPGDNLSLDTHLESTVRDAGSKPLQG